MASSDTMTYYRSVPGQTDGIPERDQRPCDDGYKSVFTISWIKESGKNQQKEWTRSLFAVPSVRGHRTVTPWTPRNNCVYTRQAAQWHATCGHPGRNRNACLKVLQLSMGKISECPYGIRCELVNFLNFAACVVKSPHFSYGCKIDIINVSKRQLCKFIGTQATV